MTSVPSYQKIVRPSPNIHWHSPEMSSYTPIEKVDFKHLQAKVRELLVNDEVFMSIRRHSMTEMWVLADLGKTNIQLNLYSPYELKTKPSPSLSAMPCRAVGIHFARSSISTLLSDEEVQDVWSHHPQFRMNRCLSTLEIERYVKPLLFSKKRKEHV